MKHLTPEELLDLIDGRAGDEDRVRLEAHLATGCERCGARVDVMRRLVQTMIADRSPEPPAHVIEAAVRIFHTDVTGSAVHDWLRGIVEEAGRLIFDSLAGAVPPVFAGARGGTSGRRLRFEGAGFELDLQVEQQAGAGRLIGQILTLEEEPQPAADVRYLVTAGGAVVAEGESDPIGEFAVDLDALNDVGVHLRSGSRAVHFEVPMAGDLQN